MLVERRLLSRQQLELALVEQQRAGRRLGEVLVGFGFVSEQALAEVLLEQVGLMDPKLPAPEAVRHDGPVEVVWENRAPLTGAEPPEPKRAGHLSAAEPEPEVRPVVKRVEDMPPRRSLGELSSLEAQVAEFERRSEAIQHSIAEIRGVLAELKAS